MTKSTKPKHPRLEDRPIKIERIGERYFGSMRTPDIKGLKTLWSNEASAEDARAAVVWAYSQLVGSANHDELSKRRARERARYGRQARKQEATSDPVLPQRG